MRLERAHAQRLGQGQGLAVVGFGLIGFRGLALRCNVAEEAQGTRLLTPFLRARAQNARPRTARACASSRRPAADAPHSARHGQCDS